MYLESEKKKRKEKKRREERRRKKKPLYKEANSWWTTTAITPIQLNFPFLHGYKSITAVSIFWALELRDAL